jgi:hypothetical protein
MIKATKYLLCFVGACLLYGCKNGDVISEFYPTRAEAESKGLFKRGWMPVWVPDDAIDIQETHNIDTGESAFILSTSSGNINLPKICYKVPKQRTPRLVPGGWPSQIPSNQLWFRCDEFVVSIVDSKLIGWRWTEAN